ncbi:MAG: metallophosphoesterase [Candidatus Moranbacteria bacterium]|nr:metallophosphoesterase [Candidatus Moranbacteria bacterium]
MNYLVFIPTVSLVLMAFFGAHYGIYAFVSHFFNPSAPQKTLLIIVIACLSVSFFVSSVAAHYVDNIFSRAFYFVSGIWMGTMLNILLAMLSAGIILQVLRWLSIPVSGTLVAGICLGGALFVSVYGVWNAMHPRIQNISVTIPNLPEGWKGKKMVQISDVHLGHIYRAPFLQKVVDAINKENPKLVVVTGDLFDGMDGSLIHLVNPLDNLTAPEGVLYVDGNHETYLGVQKTFDILQQTKVHMLHDEVTDIDGLAFMGIMYPERGEQKSIVDTIRTLQPKIEGKPSVLLYHAPAMIEEVAKTGINLQLSGHTHRGQQFPFQFVTHLVHKGYDYGLYAIGEYSLYTSSGLGTWGPAMRVGTQSEIVVITLQ